MTGKQMSPKWTFSEAWLLTATGFFGARGCSLSAMIGEADALDHNIPTETETSKSLGWLMSSGLVEMHGARYRVTKPGKKIYKQRRGSMFQLAGSVLRALESVQCVEGNIDFEPNEFDAAYEEYARR